jgi:hypothetical protein
MLEFTSTETSYTIRFSDDDEKHKAIPLQVSTGPELSRWLRLPDIKTLRTGVFSSIFIIDH